MKRKCATISEFCCKYFFQYAHIPLMFNLVSESWRARFLSISADQCQQDNRSRADDSPIRLVFLFQTVFIFLGPATACDRSRLPSGALPVSFAICNLYTETRSKRQRSMSVVTIPKNTDMIKLVKFHGCPFARYEPVWMILMTVTQNGV